MELKQLQTTRRALRDALDTNRSTTKAAFGARERGNVAYRDAFTDEEKARVLAQAQRYRADGVRGGQSNLPPVETYEQALEQFGTSLIVETLGSEA